MKKFILSLLCLFPVASAQAEPASPITVLELFTSQSCSSCPPADAFLTTLVDKPGIIALSCHVTYWNHLSWKDTHSLQACTERQRTYAPHVSGGQVFTPQMVINGQKSHTGSQAGAIHKTIEKAQSENSILPIVITRNAANQLEASSNFADTHPGAVLTLFEIGAAEDVAVPSGENRGETLNSARPVRSVTPLGIWKAETDKMQLPVIINENTKYVVLLAQNPANQQIIAAGQVHIQ